MLKKRLSLKKAFVLLALLGVAPLSSQADITVTWEQVGENVRASYAGTISLTNFIHLGVRADNWFVQPNYFRMTFDGDWLVFAAGTGSASGLGDFIADEAGGDSLLFDHAAIYWDYYSANDAGGFISGWMQFNNRTLLEMGASNFQNLKVFEGSEGNFSAFYQTVPEPNSVMTIGLGVLTMGAFLKRRRKG